MTHLGLFDLPRRTSTGGLRISRAIGLLPLLPSASPFPNGLLTKSFHLAIAMEPELPEVLYYFVFLFCFFIYFISFFVMLLPCAQKVIPGTLNRS